MLKNIISTDNIVLIITTILLILASVGVLILILYNNYYTKKKSKIFIKFFYGEVEESEIKVLEKDLNVSIYTFFLLYFLYSINAIKTAKDVFPSKEENIKPLRFLPNTYKEELDVFLSSSRNWIILNFIGFILILIVGIWICIYFFLIGI